MELLEGVKLHVEPDLRNFVEIYRSQGTIKTTESLMGHDIYEPNLPWAPVGAEELKKLLAQPTEPWCQFGSLGLVKPPEELLAPLVRILDEFGLRESYDELAKADAMRQYGDALSDIIDYLPTYLVNYEDLKYLGVSIRSTGLRTSTIDESNFLPNTPRVGLHVDDWTEYPSNRRERSPNRICVNLSLEPRHLLYMNLTLSQILDMFEDEYIYQNPCIVASTSRLSEAFLERYPDYPVLRLAIPPMCAYIAPTENIIHDGTTEDREYTDVMLTFLGHFKQAAQPVPQVGSA